MRKLWTVAVAVAFLVGFQAHAAAGEKKPGGRKLRVGTMAMTVGIPVHYADKFGLFKEAGLDIEVVVLATGAPINEAMAADQLDIAASGMASVFGLSTGRYKYIGDGLRVMRGEVIFARPDSDIAKTPGPKPGVLGSADTVRGKNILGPLATAAHLSAIKYAESLGLGVEDFNMVSMDFSQAQQAFMVGQGDLCASATPWSSQLVDAGYVMVSDLGQSQGINLVDAIFVQEKLVDECREDLIAFLDCYYQACDILDRDHELWKKVGMEWYAEEGKSITEQQMTFETEMKRYNTLDSILAADNPFGSFMITIGEFFTGLGMIPDDNFPNIKASLDDSLVRELKARRGK